MTTKRIAGRRIPLDGLKSFKALAAFSLLALVGLLLMAACGGDDDEAGTPSGTQAPAASGSPAAEETATSAAQASDGELDPCALVTREDAEAAVGASLGEPERQTTGPFETCIYSSGETISNYVQVQVSDDVYTADTFDDAIQSGAEQLETEAEPVSGVGDKAYWFAGVLWVQKGDVTLDILVNTPGIVDLRIQEDTEGEKQESLRITTELATKALDRLP